MSKTIGIITGSLRRNSFSGGIADYVKNNVPEAAVEIIFPEGIEHVTYDKPAIYKDCRVAKYQLQNIMVELIEPGEKSRPWRHFLEKHGTGVFHVCMFVQKPDEIYERLREIGVRKSYHVGTFDSGFYSYVAAKDQLGIELSINHLNQILQ